MQSCCTYSLMSELSSAFIMMAVFLNGCVAIIHPVSRFTQNIVKWAWKVKRLSETVGWIYDVVTSSVNSENAIDSKCDIIKEYKVKFWLILYSFMMSQYEYEMSQHFWLLETWNWYLIKSCICSKRFRFLKEFFMVVNFSIHWQSPASCLW